MRTLFSLGVLLVITASLPAAEPILELTVDDQSYVGCAVAHNESVCWLAHADGQLSKLMIPEVTSFRRVGDEFAGLSALKARNALRRKLGAAWNVVGTGHYLVCSTTDHSRAYAQHFEDLYRSFRRYFTQRGFDLPEPEFPLIALVYANRAAFVERCEQDGVPCVPGLRGYYHRHTNRICLYEQGEDFAEVDPRRWTAPLSRSAAADTIETPWPAIDASYQGNLKDTIVHEATHQLAFNLGLHSRIGHPPRWVVEGLATMFEAEGTRRNTGGSQAGERINQERFSWFQMYRQERYEPGSLADFVAAQDTVQGSLLDFYARAWALTFFLAETRPQQYAQYLKQTADRDPLQSYPSHERLQDFQSVFGNDLGRLEVDMLRFLDDLP